MHATPSPTGDLDPTTVARFHSRDTWLDFDRHFAGLPELVHCDGQCEAGIAQRVAVDYDPDCGPSYEPVNGSSRDPQDRDGWLCPACAAAASVAA